MIQKTRLKFGCVEASQEHDTCNIVLEPVVDGSLENESFWRWTPAGRLEFSTINEAAALMFEEGQEYYIEIHPANPPEQPKTQTPIVKYFAYEHLPPHLQEVSAPIGELARKMDEELPGCAEKSAGLRKLLEAKDCLVRARLEK